MEISYAEVKKQVDCLPISYYAKRRVNMSVSKDARTSVYVPSNNEIVISYPIIAQGLANVTDEEEVYKETAIRSMVYHELSHAIMTPTFLFNNYRCSRKIMNIFEDERIETVLENFYMNVNFKKNALYINGGTITPPADATQAFYNLVRFRVHSNPNLIKKVEQIIEKYADLTAAVSYYNYDERSRVLSYNSDVADLFDEVYQDWKQNPSTERTEDYSKKENEINETENGEGYSDNDYKEGKNEKSEENENGNGNGSKDGDGDENNSDNGNGNSDNGDGDESGDENSDNGDGNENGNESGDGDENSESGDDNGDGNGDGDENSDDVSENNKNKTPKNSGKGASRGKEDFEKICQLFKNSLNKFHDTKVIETYKGIIETFNKKNSNGNGCTGYSGIFNPRNIRNNDYKFFDRKITTKGNNKFGKLHLNLFIDNSGSFDNMSESANKVVTCLAEVERHNPNFDFDLILCGDNLRDTEKTKRFIYANEGTYATYEEVIEKMKTHTKKDSYNYNIVMYDGVLDWHTKNPFLAWDRNNTTIIDTGSNERFFRTLKNARIVITPYEELVNQLADEVGKTLKIAFR